jgi:hypothetical protein
VARLNRVVYTDPGGRGWAPVELLAELVARCLDADLIKLQTRPRIDRARRSLGLLPRRASSRGICVVIAPQPAHLGSIITPRYLLSGFDQVAGWVIDSFLDDRIPRLARDRGHFDRLFITDFELTSTWESQTGTPTECLPWGSNVLDQPDVTDHRPVDLLRVGRQPPSWDDDDATARLCARMGITFSRPPPLTADAIHSQHELTAAMRASKFTLAFSNLLSPASYTHRSRDYVTARWTESLASGAAVAGQPPRSESGRRLLWDEGTLRVSATDQADGLERVRAAAKEWHPELSKSIRDRALTTLDWRIRIRDLARSMNTSIPALDAELERWQHAIDSSD